MKSENTDITSGENLPVDTLENLFAEHMVRFVIEAGPNNTAEELGTLYRISVPKSFVTKEGVTIDMVANAAEYRTFISNNWNGVRHGFKQLDIPGKLARASDPATNGFEPSEPAVQSPLELALQNIIAKRNPKLVEGLTEAQIAKVPAIQMAVAKTRSDPTRTESYRPLVEAEITNMANWSTPRSRKGEKTAKDDSEVNY